MSMSELTVLLDGTRKGDTGARDALMAAAYQALRQLAHRPPMARRHTTPYTPRRW